MASSKRSAKAREITPCACLPETRERIRDYIEALKAEAHRIGGHGMDEVEFWRSGLFRSAIESIRGTQAASMQEKKDFIDWALTQLKNDKLISSFSFTGAGDRHDYHVAMPNSRQCIFEAKGCLDGNNTNIFQRPKNADEFLIWSLCQNPGADPRHNVWSGVHTRLGGKILAEGDRIEGLIVWDMLCGTRGRPCPKIAEGRCVEIDGRAMPPPCVYLFPRTAPDPRDNPKPHVWRLEEVALASALVKRFGGDERDITEVHIEARMSGNDVQRKTTLIRLGEVVAESGWTNLKRASR